MNFSLEIKNEILSKAPKDFCCKKAFLAGIVRGSGVIFQDGNDYGVMFSVNGEDGFLQIENLLKILYHYQINEVSVSEDNLNKKDRYSIVIRGEEAFKMLNDLEILVENGGYLDYNLKANTQVTDKECDFSAFLRGLFLSSGSCTIPSKNNGEKTKYHLEIVFSHGVPASEIAGRLNQVLINARILRRKDKVVLYIKSAEEIKNFLALIKTPKSVLKLMDLMIQRELTNQSNRAKNCDLGNVTRQIDASERQVEAIILLKQNKIYATLKKDLVETAEARLNNPDLTLTELADMLGVSKSCLNHRLRKLVSLAEEK